MSTGSDSPGRPSRAWASGRATTGFREGDHVWGSPVRRRPAWTVSASVWTRREGDEGTHRAQWRERRCSAAPPTPGPRPRHPPLRRAQGPVPLPARRSPPAPCNGQLGWAPGSSCSGPQRRRRRSPCRSGARSGPHAACASHSRQRRIPARQQGPQQGHTHCSNAAALELVATRAVTAVPECGSRSSIQRVQSAGSARRGWCSSSPCAPASPRNASSKSAQLRTKGRTVEMGVSSGPL